LMPMILKLLNPTGINGGKTENSIKQIHRMLHPEENKPTQ